MRDAGTPEAGHAEQTAREQEAFIRALFEKSPIGMNLCRLDGLWVESNQAFLGIIGYTATEADGGLTYWQLTPRKYDAAEAIQLKSLEENGRYGPYEKEFIRKDGSLVPVRLNGFIIERGGERFIWSLIEDISRERALERALETERMKSIQASKLATMGELAASFAHEINNPLSIIGAYAYEIGLAVQTNDKELIDEGVKAIEDAVARAGKIVLGLRKLARDRVDVAERIAVPRLVDEAVSLCSARLKNHGVTLTVDVQSAAFVHGSSVQLEQVIINLLNNAFDAVQGAATRTVILRAVDDGADAVIAVEDSGAGVSPENVERIFEPFFTTKGPSVGTGLGLSISRGIMAAARGTLAYEHSPLGGARFVMRLPRST